MRRVMDKAGWALAGVVKGVKESLAGLGNGTAVGKEPGPAGPSMPPI